MKPAWDDLMDEWKDSKDGLVADVDCTAAGKELCETHGVGGYPTLKWGDPADLQDYEGGRELADLQEFASENLGPTCTVENQEPCSEADKKLIEKYMKMKGYDIEEIIEKKEKLIKNQEDKYDKAKRDFERKIKDAETDKDKKIKKIKKSGLSIMRKVLAHKTKDDDKEDDKAEL